jgi:hypothetical protein
MLGGTKDHEWTSYRSCVENRLPHTGLPVSRVCVSMGGGQIRLRAQHRPPPTSRSLHLMPALCLHGYARPKISDESRMVSYETVMPRCGRTSSASQGEAVVEPDGLADKRGWKLVAWIADRVLRTSGYSARGRLKLTMPLRSPRPLSPTARVLVAPATPRARSS